MYHNCYFSLMPKPSQQQRGCKLSAKDRKQAKDGNEEVVANGTTRRKVVLGIGAVAAVAAAGGIGFQLFTRDGSSSIEASAQSSPSMADLLVQGPLPDQVQGPADAPVTIIEYASMTCSHCATFHNTTYPELKKRYIDTGKVQFILREFPLDPLAASAFMLARCAGEGKYYAVVDAFFHSQSQWAVQKPLEPMLAIARQAGFTKESFEACLTNQKMLDGIEWTRDRATKQFGVNSTPTFFINGKIVRGAMTIDELSKQIDALIKT
jgi:protein-disulfide isomerase